MVPRESKRGRTKWNYKGKNVATAYFRVISHLLNVVRLRRSSRYNRTSPRKNPLAFAVYMSVDIPEITGLLPVISDDVAAANGAAAISHNCDTLNAKLSLVRGSGVPL